MTQLGEAEYLLRKSGRTREQLIAGLLSICGHSAWFWSCKYHRFWWMGRRGQSRRLDDFDANVGVISGRIRGFNETTPVETAADRRALGLDVSKE